MGLNLGDAGCFGKTRFTSKPAALRNIAKKKRRGRLLDDPGCRLSVYRCQVCRWWHLGTTVI